jgi:signal transduction histidine kinase
LPRSWASAAFAAVALLGVAAEGIAYGASDPRAALPDLLTGWALLAAGLYATRRAPGELAGPLLGAAGAAWFAGTVLAPAVYLHRGPLLQLLLVFPSARPRTAAERAVVTGAYVAALATALWRDEPASIAAAAVLVAILARRWAVAAGQARRARRVALDAGVVLASAIAGGALVRLALPDGDPDELMLAIYEVMLVLVAWWLAAAVVHQPWQRVSVTDLVVDLAERNSDGAPVRLARALGDPTLRLLDAARHGQAATLIYREGKVVAALGHDPALASDPSLQEAVSAVAELTATHARLEAEVRARVAEVEASQRRLLHAAEDERRRLELELRERATAPLLALRDRVSDAGRARRRIELALADIDAVARGLHPRALSEGGLASGLRDLAESSGAEVLVNADLPRLPEDLEATAYYVCAEAVANAAKHARARRVRIDAAVCDGRLRLSVQDDGAGGARLIRRGGLQGLRDRVEATGGRFDVMSPAGGGTRVEVTLEL